MSSFWRLPDLARRFPLQRLFSFLANMQMFIPMISVNFMNTSCSHCPFVLRAHHVFNKHMAGVQDQTHGCAGFKRSHKHSSIFNMTQETGHIEHQTLDRTGWDVHHLRELEWTLGLPLKGGGHWKLREDWNLMHMSPTVFWMCELTSCCFMCAGSVKLFPSFFHKITFFTGFFQDSVSRTDLIFTSLTSEFSATFRHSTMTSFTILPLRESGSHWAKSKL